MTSDPRPEESRSCAIACFERRIRFCVLRICQAWRVYLRRVIILGIVALIANDCVTGVAAE
jgi:hypothetical protein